MVFLICQRQRKYSFLFSLFGFDRNIEKIILEDKLLDTLTK